MKALLNIPARMAHLPRDHRGYPIPAMVLIDDGGRPHFQINDERKRQKCIEEDRCAICGTKLFRGRWFVGGPLSAFSERGSYIDPPLHQECAEFALAVCPYLAAPHYGKEIGVKTLKGRSATGIGIAIDPTTLPDRPPFFVAVMAVATDVIRQADVANPLDGHAALGYTPEMVRFVRHRPGTVRDIRVWQGGSRVTDPAALDAFAEGVWPALAAQGDSGRSDMLALWRATRK
jgi:hypothetical protein